MSAFGGAPAAAVGPSAELSRSIRPSADGALSPLCASCRRDSRLSNHYHTGDSVARRTSLVGEPVATIIDRMVAASAAEDGGAAARAEFCVAWPPTFPVGGAAEVIELRAAVVIGRATAAAAADDDVCDGGAALSGGGGREAVLAAAAAGCCSRLLALREDVVVGDEAAKMLADGGGRAQARLRLHCDQPGVTTCILTGGEGVPTLESFEDAAPLMGLPQAARDEAHRLLWRMMHEALPPNHSVLPYDADAFRSPIDLLPARLQAALSWAWSQHFRAFAHDFAYLLAAPPPPGADVDATTRDGSGAAANPRPVSGPDELLHYQSVLAQMVVFLRDNDMFACLATLLQTAVGRGLVLVGEGGACVAPPTPPPAAPESPASPSVASDASDEPLAAVTDSGGSADGTVTEAGTMAAAAAPPLQLPPAPEAGSSAQGPEHDLTSCLAEAEAGADASSVPPTPAPPQQRWPPVLLFALCWTAVAATRLWLWRDAPMGRGSWAVLFMYAIFIAVNVGLTAARCAAAVAVAAAARRGHRGVRYVTASSPLRHGFVTTSCGTTEVCGDGDCCLPYRVSLSAVGCRQLLLGAWGLAGAAHVAAVTWFGADAAAAAAATGLVEARSTATAAAAVVLLLLLPTVTFMPYLVRDPPAAAATASLCSPDPAGSWF